MSRLNFSVNSQPWRCASNSLGIPYTPSLPVCLFPWACVVYVCFLLYLSVSLCVARCLFGVLQHIHKHLFDIKHTYIYLLLYTWPCPYGHISLPSASSYSLFLCVCTCTSIRTYLPLHVHLCLPPNIHTYVHKIVLILGPFIDRHLASNSIFQSMYVPIIIWIYFHLKYLYSN